MAAGPGDIFLFNEIEKLPEAKAVYEHSTGCWHRFCISPHRKARPAIDQRNIMPVFL
jgi:hypothetical protein